jgi:hypothetical protein
MQTPVWSSERILPRPLRTVDLYPAMLDWLGVPVPPGIDGELVWRPGERRRRADTAARADRTEGVPSGA